MSYTQSENNMLQVPPCKICIYITMQIRLFYILSQHFLSLCILEARQNTLLLFSYKFIRSQRIMIMMIRICRCLNSRNFSTQRKQHIFSLIPSHFCVKYVYTYIQTYVKNENNCILLYKIDKMITERKEETNIPIFYGY